MGWGVVNANASDQCGALRSVSGSGHDTLLGSRRAHTDPLSCRCSECRHSGPTSRRGCDFMIAIGSRFDDSVAESGTSCAKGKKHCHFESTLRDRQVKASNGTSGVWSATFGSWAWETARITRTSASARKIPTSRAIRDELRSGQRPDPPNYMIEQINRARVSDNHTACHPDGSRSTST